MKTVKSLNWLMVIAGLWLILSPFILNYSAVVMPMWNAIILGVALIVLAIWASLRENVRLERTLDWITAILGLWLIVSPLVLNFSTLMVPMWNAIIIGALVVVLSLGAEYAEGKLVAR
jgi:hypothetical protein